jgi:hypothetical protein
MVLPYLKGFLLIKCGFFYLACGSIVYSVFVVIIFVDLFKFLTFKYEMWSIRMKVFLQAHGHYIFLSVVTRYDSSKREKTATKKELRKNNKITMDFIWEGLPNLVREKVGKCSSAKELWDKLHDIYSSSIADSKNAKEDAYTE